MREKIIFVFHNGQKSGELTYDCKLRIKAARQIALENPTAKICFVGGGEIKGASEMKKFWQENYSELSNELLILEKANNTADGIKEIIEYISNYKYKEENEIILISNLYHIKRIEFFAKSYGLEASFIAAEDILIIADDFNDEIKKYRNSFVYYWKLLLEKIAMFYIAVDSDQKMVKLWREYVRNLEK
ncbi:MAG: ElyC/SanA/YdcF family protein [Candidatus Moranbacteria bacterium]|nr:ElyC/SanA/YdcF family protein [Candidatus Moranbacteria bacterium]